MYQKEIIQVKEGVYEVKSLEGAGNLALKDTTKSGGRPGLGNKGRTALSKFASFFPTNQISS